MNTKPQTILFIGAFLSRQTGTKGVMEKLEESFADHPFLRISLVSKVSPLLLRGFDTLFSVLFKRYDNAHLDVYSGRSFYFSALLGRMLYWRSKPFIITLRGGRLAEFYEHNPRIIRSLLLQAKRVQTPSRFLQAFFETKGYQVAYLPNPIHLDIFQLPPASTRRKPFALLWVRAFEAVYNPGMPVDILYLLLREFPEATLTMVGPDKGLLADVRQKAAILGLEKKITFTGPVPNEQLPAFYQSHSVFLNTTSYESFGVAVAEAAACGIPIVSSAVGEIPHLWQNREEIILSKSMDAESFAIAAKQVFDNPALAQSLARNARKKSETFDFQEIKQHWESILSTNLTRNASPIKPLFVGNFLSAKRGTLGPTETLTQELSLKGMNLTAVSSQESKILRALDILSATLFRSYSLICADVFSGNILKILPLISIIAHFRRKPLVLVLHGGQLHEVYQNHKIVLNWIFRSAKLLVTPSPHLKSFFEKQGFILKYLPNAIHLDLFPFAQTQFNPKAPRLLWIRAFSALYNPTLAVDILAELRKTHPEASLTMIGPDSGNLDQTLAYIAQKGLEHAVKITGPVANAALSPFHHSHTVLINTTSYESFGISVLEAAASGIPIVSSGVGSIPLLWEDEQEILMVKLLDHTAFVQQIRRILDAPALARQRAERARQKAESFSIQAIAPKWQSLFNGILEQ